MKFHNKIVALIIQILLDNLIMIISTVMMTLMNYLILKINK